MKFQSLRSALFVMALSLGVNSANAVPLNDNQERAMRQEINLELEKNIERLFKESASKLDVPDTNDNRIKENRLDIVSDRQ